MGLVTESTKGVDEYTEVLGVRRVQASISET